MIKILFVCHGNICRSPMAEYVLADMAHRRGLSDRIAAQSAATSYEEIGNDIHRGTKGVLRAHGVPFEKRAARRMTAQDYETFDLLIGMDRANLSNMRRIAGGDAQNKIHSLLSYAGLDRDIADPWYTDDYEATFRDVVLGCGALLDALFKA